MILVTVGMHTQPFDRLVRAAGELASLVDEPVVVQRGTSSCVPQGAQFVDYADEAQMQEWLSEARIVISHAGAGTILGALRAGKPLVLAPRSVRFDESCDDHQFELAGALAERRRAVVVTELSAESLSEALEQAAQLGSMRIGETSLHAALRGWLVQQAARPPSRRWRLFCWIGGGG
jgi:UDP-N-acetylglucosamine transferase subunit ALG13